MKGFSAKPGTVIRVMLVTVAILPLIATSISAQQGQAPTGAMRPSPTGGSVPERAAQPSVRERQNKMLEMEREAARVRTPEQEKLALAQIAEDYEKIQVVNNNMMAATMKAAAPDYARIAEVTAEIKMRANRMKENLRLAKPASRGEKGSDYKNAQDAAGLKINLLSLDGSVMSFIKSPIFLNPNVVDVKQAEKASRDLENIIEFSNLINKDAQKLSKSKEKTP